MSRERLTKKLRDGLYFSEGDITDEELLSLTKGTLFRAGIEGGLAGEDLARALKDELQKILIRAKGLFGSNES